MSSLRNQADIARGAEIDPAVLSRFLSGKRTLNMATFTKLCDYLQLELRPIAKSSDVSQANEA